MIFITLAFSLATFRSSFLLLPLVFSSFLFQNVQTLSAGYLIPAVEAYTSVCCFAAILIVRCEEVLSYSDVELRNQS
jgi:hypothetical protein